jgi:hypothetical protein
METPTGSTTDDPGRGLSRLIPADLQVLRDWLIGRGNTGIERIEDLGSRAWSGPKAEFILGVFRCGEPFAAWLLVGDHGTWAVASRADGSVSAPFDSLADALSELRRRATARPA